MAGRLAVAAVCGALLAGCNAGGGRSARHVVTSTSTTAATTTTTAPLITYQVKPGDTLTAIAKQFGIGIADILAINQLADQDHLTEGQSLLIPPAPPVKLVITPPEGQPGQAFELTLTGAKPSETVTFEIDSPDGKFTGPPHTPSADGAVTATYQTSAIATTGTYTVVAKGDQGTTAQARFRVAPGDEGSQADRVAMHTDGVT